MGVDEFRACEHLKADEKESILWAVKTVRTLCSSEEVIADKNRCAFPQWHPRVTGGEPDCLCPALGKLFDLKSGQIRNYWEQQASYAKSFMEREFLDEITCHLLYCDQQQIVTRKFTYREAISIVNGVVDTVDRGGGPRLCDYCGWCASQGHLPAAEPGGAGNADPGGSRNAGRKLRRNRGKPVQAGGIRHQGRNLGILCQKRKRKNPRLPQQRHGSPRIQARLPERRGHRRSGRRRQIRHLDWRAETPEILWPAQGGRLPRPVRGSIAGTTIPGRTGQDGGRILLRQKKISVSKTATTK